MNSTRPKSYIFLDPCHRIRRPCFPVLLSWDVLTPSPERRLIDDAVFDMLGLTQGERDGVYEGVTELVENRLRRARSVR